MIALRGVVGLLVLAVTVSGWAQQQPATAEVRISVSGADDPTVVVRDPQGIVAASGELAVDATLGSARVELSRFDEGFYEVRSPLGTPITIDLAASIRPVEIQGWVESQTLRLAVYRFPPTTVEEGRRVRVEVALDGGLRVRLDGDGDGEPETEIAPSVTLIGAVANDRTPPLVAYERQIDGRHALRLLDEGVDITTDGELFASTDSGRSFFRYTEPLELDPLVTPTLIAVGKDRAGNTSDAAGFSTQLPFCERVARDRSMLQSGLRTALADALAEGVLASTDGVAALASGRAACLWRTGFFGAELACETCAGVYVPSLDAIELELYLPASVAPAARARVAELVASRIDDPVRRLGEARVVARALSELEAARLEVSRGPGDRDHGLARQLGLLRSLLTGDYVDLEGAGPDLSGPPLDFVLTSLQTAGAVPALEGFEAARRAELEMLASELLVRVVGMGADLVADAPESDSHLSHVLRRQLETAAEGALSAGAGLLAVDVCTRDNALLAVSRSDFRDDGCNGAPCATFEAFVATRIAAAATICPSTFLETTRAAFDAYRRLSERESAALVTIAGDDCTANGSLAAALALARQLATRTRAAYDAGLGATNPAERAQRESNAAAALDAIGERTARPSLDLGIELSNKSPNVLPELVARLYVDDVSTGQERRVTLAPGERSFSLGSALRNEPFFLRIDAAQTPTNEPRSAVLVFDPDNALGRTRAGPKFSGLSFYRFDPGNPICPPAAPLRLPPSLEVSAP